MSGKNKCVVQSEVRSMKCEGASSAKWEGELSPDGVINFEGSL